MSDIASTSAKNKVTNKTKVALIAEDQFLYSDLEEVNQAIIAKTKQLAEKGTKFIDARKGKENENFNYTKLNPNGDYIIYKPHLLGDEIADELKKAVDFQIPKPDLAVAAKIVNAQTVKLCSSVVREGAGTGNIAKDQAQKSGCIVMNLPGKNSLETSKNTLHAIYGSPHITKAGQMAIAGEASALNLKPLYGDAPDIDTKALNDQVRGKTVAVLGAGNIGTQTILALLKSEAQQVKVYSRSLVDDNGQPKTLQVKEALKSMYPGLDINKLQICKDPTAAVKDSNIMVNHMALATGAGGTEGIIGADQLQSMAKGAQIIDAARPGIINPVALVENIKSGHLSRVVVDWDTPDKDPDNKAINTVFEFAKKSDKITYSPHAFTDASPSVRLGMFDGAMSSIHEVRKGLAYNCVSIGGVPEGYVDQGQRKPDGIFTLNELITKRSQELARPSHANDDLKDSVLPRPPVLAQTPTGRFV